jgi:hypothetical protein
MTKGKGIKRFSAAELEKRRERGKSRTDLARVRAKTEEELERDIASDPDWKRRAARLVQRGGGGHADGKEASLASARRGHCRLVQEARPWLSDEDERGSPRLYSAKPLRGDREGCHSIDQWRIVFRWSDFGPEDVEIVDYHS